jgi:hypothetical protein
MVIARTRRRSICTAISFPRWTMARHTRTRSFATTVKPTVSGSRSFRRRGWAHPDHHAAGTQPHTSAPAASGPGRGFNGGHHQGDRQLTHGTMGPEPRKTVELLAKNSGVHVLAADERQRVNAFAGTGVLIQIEGARLNQVMLSMPKQPRNPGEKGHDQHHHHRDGRGGGHADPAPCATPPHA